MDSFIELSAKKEFKDITIKDITTEAMINRATFYYHFEDIYDLLEKALSEVLLVNLNEDVYKTDKLNEEAIIHIFTVITNFQKSLSNRCHRGYEDTIARIIREQLEIIFYGVSVEWKRKGMTIPPEDFIKPSIPYLLSGIDYGS
jgi:AcrR family transcriptional regulator